MIILEPLTPQFPGSVFASLPLSTLIACDPAHCLWETAVVKQQNPWMGCRMVPKTLASLGGCLWPTAGEVAGPS